MHNADDSADMLRRRAEAFNKAILTSAAEEEARLAQTIGELDLTWLIEDWLPVGHKGQIAAPEGSFISWRTCLSQVLFVKLGKL